MTAIEARFAVVRTWLAHGAIDEAVAELDRLEAALGTTATSTPPQQEEPTVTVDVIERQVEPQLRVEARPSPRPAAGQRRERRIHADKTKREAAGHAHQHGVAAAADEFDVANSLIRKWMVTYPATNPPPAVVGHEPRRPATGEASQATRDGDPGDLYERARARAAANA